MDTAPFLWTDAQIRTELRHLLCDDPATGACNLRFPERANVPGRHTNTDWAAFQLAAHARADVVTAMTELWPETAGLDWEHLKDRQVRDLAGPVQALWILVVRGPGDQSSRTPIPEGQAPSSRFGFVSWHAAERILRSHRKTIRAAIDDAIGQIRDWLNYGEERTASTPATRAFRCTPDRHIFAVGGTPHPEALCYCGRTVYRERAG